MTDEEVRQIEARNASIDPATINYGEPMGSEFEGDDWMTRDEKPKKRKKKNKKKNWK